MSHRRAVGLLLVSIALVAWAPTSLAGSIGTLTLSSDSSEVPDPSLLDAAMTFDVQGTNLLLTVSNDTDAYIINSIYFNSSSDVTGLSLVSATYSDGTDVTQDWGGVGAVSSGKANGFGTFDFALLAGGGFAAPPQIGAGDSITYEFAISGSGSYDWDDFVALSEQAGTIEALAAAKFVSGPGDESGFGALVPLPSSAWMGLSMLGCLLLPDLRRRLRR